VPARSLSERVRDLEEFQRDCAPALEFYNDMVPEGLKSVLPEMMREFNRNQALKDLMSGRRGLHQFRAVQIGALGGVLVAATSVGAFALALLSYLHLGPHP
jgi:hypothetical protein